MWFSRQAALAVRRYPSRPNGRVRLQKPSPPFLLFFFILTICELSARHDRVWPRVPASAFGAFALSRSQLLAVLFPLPMNRRPSIDVPWLISACVLTPGWMYPKQGLRSGGLSVPPVAFLRCIVTVKTFWSSRGSVLPNPSSSQLFNVRMLIFRIVSAKTQETFSFASFTPLSLTHFRACPFFFAFVYSLCSNPIAFLVPFRRPTVSADHLRVKSSPIFPSFLLQCGVRVPYRKRFVSLPEEANPPLLRVFNQDVTFLNYCLSHLGNSALSSVTASPNMLLPVVGHTPFFC